MKQTILLICFLVFTTYTFGENNYLFNRKIIIYNNDSVSNLVVDDTIPAPVKGKRLKATIITILTGPLGGHRIYLGTKPIVPIFYTLTLGGGIIVTVIDLGYLIFSKDISRFENNKSFFMWIKKKQ
ncbi:MAG: hypothetical protein Kow0068_11610 [Marinilabiliales bacterium]